MIRKKTRLLKLISCALLALMFALGGGLGALAAEKTLYIGAAIFPDSLRTGQSSFASLCLNLQTTDALIRRNNDTSIEPGLALKWEPVSDTQWRFFLRQGVKFHDGVEFTSADVKDTLDFVLDPKSVYAIKRRVNQIDRVEVVDKYTVDIYTKKPFPTLIRGLSEISIEPKHIHQKVGREGLAKHPIGTGPFKFVKWVPGDRLELVANKDYWGGAPKVDRVIIRQIPEAATRVAALLAGEVQIIEEVPVDLIPKVEATSGVEIAAVESTVGLCLTMDTRKPPYDNPKVRLAMDYAVNKSLIMEKMLMGKGTLLKGQLLTSNTFGHNPNLKARPYDPKKAKQLLKEAGYPNGFKTSITTRSGKYLSDVDICNAVAGMLAEVGITATVNVVEGGVYSKMVKARDMGPIHMVGWYSLGDGDFSTVWFTKGSVRSYWKNDEYEKLFLKGRSTVNKDERLAAYHRMMEIMQAENPAVFMFGLPSIYAKSSSLSGWSPPSDKILRLYKAKLK